MVLSDGLRIVKPLVISTTGGKKKTVEEEGEVVEDSVTLCLDPTGQQPYLS